MLKTSLLEGLNKAQCDAVMHGKGPALVVAGPGSGKTLTIVRRLLYLIYGKGVSPEKILVITYTKEAALAMQEKFYLQFKKFDLKRSNLQGYVSFGTFHSYFYQVIKSISKYSEYQLITQQEKVKIVRKIHLESSKEEVSEFTIKRFLEEISYFKNTGNYRNNEWGESLFQKYEAALHRYRRMDFDDMLYLCKKEFIQNPTLLERCRNQYEYVLIDEYQDINPIQYELIAMLTKEHQNLFVVGDDDQAIYGFRGSDSKAFQKLPLDFANTKIIHLSINYRCSDIIVKASQKLIKRNVERVAKNIVSGVKEEKVGKISIYSDENNSMNYERVLMQLKDKSIEELENEAVLFRTNAALQMFACKLGQQNIPFILREKTKTVFEHFIAQDITDYFKAANGCKERSLYLRIFQKQGIDYARELLRCEQVELHEIKSRIAEGFYEERILLSRIECLERNLNRLQNMRPKLGIQYILHAMEYEKYLLRKANNYVKLPEEWKEVINCLMEDANDFYQFSDWIEHQEKCMKSMEKSIILQASQKKGIHLMTIHASKGLEFEKVYLMNLNEGTIPRTPKGEEITQARVEEERRLLYVGLTRAKNAVDLYYVRGNPDNPRIKSRFLEEMEIEEDGK